MAGSEGFQPLPERVGPGRARRARSGRFTSRSLTAQTARFGVYRDGLPYGEPYKTAKPAVFAAGEAVILFGQRHTPAGGNRGLSGTLMRARLYDRALEPARDRSLGGELPRLHPRECDHRGACRASEGKSGRGFWPRSSGCGPRWPPIRACTPSRRARRERRTSRSEAIRISPERS